jgi:beta-barrel assembly-enhancing protease
MGHGVGMERASECNLGRTLDCTSDRVFNGRLFGPDISGAGLNVSASWLGNLLTIDTELPLNIPASELHVDAAGFNMRQLRVSWKDSDGEFAFFIEQEEARKTFFSTAPPCMAASLSNAKKMQRSLNKRFHALLGAYGLYLALPAIALALFLFNLDRVVGWTAAKIPIEYETKIGNMVLAQTRAQARVIESGPALDAVRHIGGRLTDGSRYQYRWLLVQNNEVNAFAAPGGVIVVYSGLIRQTTHAEELAGVLAHEVAHVELRHSLHGMIKKAGFGILLSFVMGDWSGGAIGSSIAALTEMKFSRDAETQADKEGLRRLVAAQISPQGMPEFFAGLAKKEAQGPDLSMISTHPPSQERMELLQQEIRRLPVRNYPPLDLDWKTIKATL